MSHRRPRAFISYRHADTPDGEVNAAHRAWVGRMVEGLAARGMQAIWDADIREALRPHCKIDPLELPLCAEVSRAFTLIVDAFVPIVTTGYLERTGVMNGKETNSPSYGVVWEEWQGGAFLVQKGLLIGVPVLRRGRLVDLNVNSLMTTMGATHMIDMREDGASHFDRGLDAIVAGVHARSRINNYFALIEPAAFCAYYIAWARTHRPDRRHAPVDVWWFHTGEAAEFVGHVSQLTLDSDNDDPNQTLREETQRVLAQLATLPKQATWEDLIGFTSVAQQALNEQFGIVQVESATHYAESMLAENAVKGTPVELSRVHNNVGRGWFRIGQRTSDAAMLARAEIHFRHAATMAQASGGEDLVKPKANLVETLMLRHAVQRDAGLLPQARKEAEELLALTGGASLKPETGGWHEKAAQWLEEIRRLESGG